MKRGQVMGAEMGGSGGSSIGPVTILAAIVMVLCALGLLYFYGYDQGWNAQHVIAQQLYDQGSSLYYQVNGNITNGVYLNQTVYDKWYNDNGLNQSTNVG